MMSWYGSMRYLLLHDLNGAVRIIFESQWQVTMIYWLPRLERGNKYIMVAYHCNLNMILTAPFKSRSDKHRMLAYNDIMQRLKARGMLVNL